METIRMPGSLGTLYGVLQMPASRGPVPLVILSHGFGGNFRGSMDWADCFTGLGFATFAFDFCGGGPESMSGGSMLDMTVETEAEDLGRVMDHFQRDKRFSGMVLFGQSQGGFISAMTAVRRPREVSGLILEFPAIVLQDDARARALEDGSFPAVSEVLGHTISRKFNETAVAFDLYDLIGAYEGPVLILHGDRDEIVPLRYSQRAAEVFPHAELVVMPGQGHGFTGEAKREAMEKEGAFLRRVFTTGDREGSRPMKKEKQKMSRVRKLEKQVWKVMKKTKKKDWQDRTAHLHCVAMTGAMLAMKRGENPEIAAMAGLLHDLYAYREDSYKDHARRGADYARKILEKLKITSDEETEVICRAIRNHDLKDAVGTPMEEILKDADVMHHCLADPAEKAGSHEQARFDQLRRELGLR